MSARIVPLRPEPPVNPQDTLYAAQLRFAMALLPPPCPSELIEQLARTTDPQLRLAIADQIGRSAP